MVAPDQQFGFGVLPRKMQLPGPAKIRSAHMKDTRSGNMFPPRRCSALYMAMVSCHTLDWCLENLGCGP